MPVTPDEIDDYLQRLDRVSQALEFAQHKYADALAEHTDLVALLDAYVAKAQAQGVAEQPRPGRERAAGARRTRSLPGPDVRRPAAGRDLPDLASEGDRPQ